MDAVSGDEAGMNRRPSSFLVCSRLVVQDLRLQDKESLLGEGHGEPGASQLASQSAPSDGV